MSDKKTDQKEAAPPAPEATPVAPAPLAATPPPAEKKTKPAPLNFEQMAHQIQDFQKQKEQLSHTLTHLESQLHRIQTAIHESDQLRAQVQKEMTETYSNFKAEWKRKTDLFPEIRYLVVQKAADSQASKK